MSTSTSTNTISYHRTRYLSLCFKVGSTPASGLVPYQFSMNPKAINEKRGREGDAKKKSFINFFLFHLHTLTYVAEQAGRGTRTLTKWERDIRTRTLNVLVEETPTIRCIIFASSDEIFNVVGADEC